MHSPDQLLADIFGYDAFRTGQREIVEAVTAGKNTLAIMPTGGGKSLCFQLPALCREGVTLVVSPLIALMRDQVRALQELGINAHALTSANTDEENQACFDAIEQGALKLLYLAPERLASHATFNMLKRAGTSLIAVDEAHCVSQWGHDFRPDYLRIGQLRKALDVPLAAFTATADAETRDEMVARLFEGETPEVFLHGFDRPNLTLAFTPKNKPREQILRFASARKGQSGIVYTGTRNKTESLASALRQEGHSAYHYHGGMDPIERRKVEELFQREDGLIVVATIAFGMGIDKPDIRWVAHADLPKSVESYYQEIGRAGRDGAPADTLTLYGADDIRFRRTQIDEGLAPPEMKAADHGRLNALLGIAEAQVCRRVTLLSYFGEESAPCDNCDLCAKPPELFDGTTSVRKALSAILRTDEWFGAGHLIDILLGNATDRVREKGHDALPTFGVGREHTKAVWNAIFRQMMGADLIRPDPSRHGALRMTQNARPILRNEASITLRRDTLAQSSTTTKVRMLVSEEDAPLLSALKAKRRGLSERESLPAYMVFNDKTLIEMAQKRPNSLDAMAHISGVGAKKLEKYGQAFLEVITGAPTDTPHPARRKLAGQNAGTTYDALLAVQNDLARGPMGTDRPMSCSTSQLAKLAKAPADAQAISRILGDRHSERFADAFLEVLQNR